MKMLRDLAKNAMEFLVAGADQVDGPHGDRVIEKRAGIFVSRQVLNAKAWNEWAVEAGVPDPIPAADMHVTVINSVIDVKMAPNTEVITASTNRAVICLLGLKDDALVVCFDSWILWDRHYDFLEAGAVSSFPGFKNHFSLSYNAAGFEISDEALAAMPKMIILGPERYSAARGAPDPVEDTETEEVTATKSKSVLHELEKGLVGGELSLLDEYALRDLARMGRATVFKGQSAEIEKTIAPAAPRSIEKEFVLTVRSPSKEMMKSAKVVDLFKVNEEERLFIGWASVSTVKGELVEDLQGDTITVKAQREFLHDIIRGQRSGKFEHQGEVVNEIVEGIIMDNDLQKALGIDLGMEGMLLVTHVPDDQNWEMVKSGDWMYSIAGTVLVLEEE
jgi:hypothetical protein